MKCLFRGVITAALLIGVVIPVISGSIVGQENTKKVFLVGNSLTDGVNYDGLAKLAANYGYNHQWDKLNCPGAPIDLLWSLRSDVEATFNSKVWDVFTLQPSSREIEGAGGDHEAIDKFADYASANNPNVQIYQYETWPTRPENGATAALFTKMWDSIPQNGSYLIPSRKHQETLIKAIRLSNGNLNKQILMIPAAEVMYIINKKFAQGLIPGYTSVWDLYNDGVHLNNIGSYMVGLTFFSVIYKADPRGTVVPIEYKVIAPAVVKLVQESVYEVVFSYQYTGVTLSDIVPVTKVSVAPSSINLKVLQSSKLTPLITPVEASRKNVTWYSDNTKIVIVDQSGMITGLSAGTAKVWAKSTDGGFTGSSDVNVTGVISGATSNGILAKWDIVGKQGVRTITASSHLTGVLGAAPSLVAELGQGLQPVATFDNALLANNQSATTFSEAMGDQEYVSLTVAPAPGYLLSVNKLHINFFSQNGGRHLVVVSNVKGFTFEQKIWLFSGEGEVDIPVTMHENLPGAVEFRIYFYSSTGEPPNGYGSVGIGSGCTIEGSVIKVADSEKPSAPSTLTLTPINAGTTTLSWLASTDNIGVAGYYIYKDNVKVNQLPVRNTEYLVSGLPENASYSFKVTSVDFGGNESTESNIVRLDGNRAPTAVVHATPINGNVPLTVSFDCKGSSDPDASDFILGFDWDFGDGSVKSINNEPTHTYTKAGTYIVTLRVMDNRNMYSAPVKITIQAGSVLVKNPVQIVKKNSSVNRSFYTLNGKYCKALHLRSNGASVNIQNEGKKMMLIKK